MSGVKEGRMEGLVGEAERFRSRPPGPDSVSFRTERIRQAVARARVNAERAPDPWMRQIAQELAESLERQA